MKSISKAHVDRDPSKSHHFQAQNPTDLTGLKEHKAAALQPIQQPKGKGQKNR